MSDQLKKLAETRASAWEKAKTHLETVQAEGREFTGEADETWKRLNDELNALDARIVEVRELEDGQKAADEIRARYADAAQPADARDNGKPSDLDAIRKLASGEIRAWDFGPGEARSNLSVGTTTAGGYTVPTSFYGMLQEHLVETSGVLQSNPTVLNTASGETLQVPKTTTHSTAALITEGSSITASDAAFGQISLGAYKLAFTTQVSSELEQDTAVDLAAYLARAGGRALGIKADSYYTVGTGSSQPKGIVAAASSGVTGATSTSGAFTADNLIDLFHSVIAPYRTNACWGMNDTSVAALRKLKDTTNQYLWQPGLTAGEGATLLGKPLVTFSNMVSPGLSAKSVVFGDMSTYFVRNAGGVRVERSVDYAFTTDLVTYRFIIRTDGNLVDTTGAVKYFIGGAS